MEALVEVLLQRKRDLFGATGRIRVKLGLGLQLGLGLILGLHLVFGYGIGSIWTGVDVILRNGSGKSSIVSITMNVERLAVVHA